MTLGKFATKTPIKVLYCTFMVPETGYGGGGGGDAESWSTLFNFKDF